MTPLPSGAQPPPIPEMYTQQHKQHNNNSSSDSKEDVVTASTRTRSTSFATATTGMTASGRTDDDNENENNRSEEEDEDEEEEVNSNNKVIEKEKKNSLREERYKYGPAAVDDDGDPCTISLVLTLWSHIMFVIGTCFYVAMAVVGLQFEYQVQDYPDEVVLSQDDDIWVQYGFQDDFILNFGDTEDGVWVSRYTTFYFLAAFCFLLTGFLDYGQEPGLVPAIFIMAGAFGVASATVSQKDERLSNILNCISVHLFCLEAISHYLYRHWLGDAHVWLKYFVHFGDACWIVGSSTDVVLSYISLMRTRYSVPLAKADVAAASLWLTCSMVYIVATLIQASRLLIEYRKMLQQKQQDRQFKQEMTTTTREQPSHIPNRGSRYAQQQLRQQQSSDSTSSSLDYGVANNNIMTMMPNNHNTNYSLSRPTGTSGHSNDTVNV